MNDAPILVSGMPRSGTTWMQHYLCSHPRIHIHGQPPRDCPWSALYGWYQQMIAFGEWSREANAEMDYDVAHYAGSDKEKCGAIFRRLFREFMTGFGPETPRWGLKMLGTCWEPKSVEQIKSLWPETRWIIGVRNPRKSITSLKNTFLPDLDVTTWVQRWVWACQFIESQPSSHVAVFDIDALAEMSIEERQVHLEQVWNCIGETESEETVEFVRDWNRVHEFRPHDQRESFLDDELFDEVIANVPEATRFIEQYGFVS